MPVQKTRSQQKAAKHEHHPPNIKDQFNGVRPSKRNPSPYFTARDPFTPVSEGDKEDMIPEEYFGQLSYFHAAMPGQMAHPTPVTARIEATFHKNFFVAEEEWTCYRRNYISCTCSYWLSHTISPTKLYFTETGSTHPYAVVAFAMSVAAVVSGNEQQEKQLDMYTAKRNPATAKRPPKVHLAPGSGGCLDDRGHFHMCGVEETQTSSLSKAGGLPLPREHTFERVQYKDATKNNGKRRASQQYFRFVVELWAQIDKGDGRFEYTKVMHRNSSRMIVRGRSPGHYTPGKTASRNESSTPNMHTTSLPIYNNIQGPSVGDYHPASVSMPQEAYQPYDQRGQLYGVNNRGHELSEVLPTFQDTGRLLEQDRHFSTFSHYSLEPDRLDVFPQQGTMMPPVYDIYHKHRADRSDDRLLYDLPSQSLRSNSRVPPLRLHMLDTEPHMLSHTASEARVDYSREY